MAGVTGALFVLPAMLLVTLIVLLPLAQALYYSFTDWNGLRHNWIGLANYANVLADPELRQSLTNSIILFASVPFALILPFVTAYLLSKQLPGNRLFRTIIFAPTALSWVVIGIVGQQFFSIQGPINFLAGSFGWKAPNWLADSSFALGAVTLTFHSAIFGLNTIIFLTGLSTIDHSTIEAARIDGASELGVVRYIIAPAMRRYIAFVAILTVVISFTGLFGMLFVMTGGGPGAATMTLDFAVWRRAFSAGAFGTGAAIGITLMAVTLVGIALVRLVLRNGSDE